MTETTLAAGDDSLVPITTNPESESHAIEAPTWENDETIGTLVLRATTTVVVGCLLAWAQYQCPIRQPEQWGQWVGMSVLCNFVLPLGVVWMFFGQGLLHCDWLTDQKHNAWSYGWNFRQLRRHVLISLGLFAVMIGPIWFYSRQPETLAVYRNYFPPVQGFGPIAWFLGSVVLYMFCWEWFFRGFMLFGTAQGVGPIAAILLQALLFGVTHWGKPGPEMWSSFAGGLFLGALSWHEKSFVPAFLTHALVHLALAVFVLMEIGKALS